MSKTITKSKLTIKQELFCQEYIKDFNGTQAAIRAGYSKKTAGHIAIDNLRKLTIQDRIRYLSHKLKKYFDNEDITIQTIVRHLGVMAAFDISEIYDKKGNLKKVHDWPEHIRRIAQGVKTNKTEISEAIFTEVQEVKFPDRTKATEMLGRYLKMFVDRVEHSGEINLTIRPASQDDGGNGKLEGGNK